jgi:hypothetical protein
MFQGVGIYLPIDRHRCFVAHINAYDNREDPRESGSRFVSPDIGKFFRIAVREKLEEHATKHDWTHVSRSNLLKGLIMVCSHLFLSDEFADKEPRAPGILRYLKGEQTGYWVIEGIKDFLKVRSDVPQETLFKKIGGFVVDHCKREDVRYLGVTRPDGPPGKEVLVQDMDAYEEVKQTETEDWNIAFTGGFGAAQTKAKWWFGG